MNITKKQFVLFISFAFISAWILQVIASYFSNNGNQSVFQIILALTMFMPLFGTLIARIPLRGMGWIPHLKGKIIYLFFALWSPCLLSLIGGLLFFLIFPYTFDSEFLTLKNLFSDAGILESMEAQGITIPMYIAISSIQAITFAPFINMFLAIGEEVGWRGVLFSYLKEKLGVTKGRILGGIIWGIWHWPVMILAGYEYGKDYIGAPFLGPIVFCIFTVAIGILLDYIYDKTKTIWIPSLMHGAINAFTVFAYLIRPEYSDKAILGPASLGIISVIPYIILAAIICIKQTKSKIIR